MEDLITVTFFNQSPSWEGRLIVCLFADTRFLERYCIFWGTGRHFFRGLQFSVALIFFHVYYFSVSNSLCEIFITSNKGPG